MVSLSKAHPGPHDGVDILGDHIKELGEVGDEDVHNSVLKSGEVQLHVHRADHFLEGYPSYASHEAGPPRALWYKAVPRA